MKRFKNIGTVLSKEQQRQVFGGVDVFRRPCIEEETGGKCCYEQYIHTDPDTGEDYTHWRKTKECVGGQN
ncbi:hypothetical protein BKI52_03575 [marine bacterium AO1-C]|nr:hypothetical protein BKI52_03575 [marine bacterium AO1-C]